MGFWQKPGLVGRDFEFTELSDKERREFSGVRREATGQAMVELLQNYQQQAMNIRGESPVASSVGPYPVVLFSTQSRANWYEHRDRRVRNDGQRKIIAG